ncbi:MAG: hypothetical protein ACOCP8_01945 [archaeon]
MKSKLSIGIDKYNNGYYIYIDEKWKSYNDDDISLSKYLNISLKKLQQIYNEYEVFCDIENVTTFKNVDDCKKALDELHGIELMKVIRGEF